MLWSYANFIIMFIFEYRFNVCFKLYYVVTRTIQVTTVVPVACDHLQAREIVQVVCYDREGYFHTFLKNIHTILASSKMVTFQNWFISADLCTCNISFLCSWLSDCRNISSSTTISWHFLHAVLWMHIYYICFRWAHLWWVSNCFSSSSSSLLKQSS